MRFCILAGSPRKQGNTAQLLKPFMAELESSGHELFFIHLPDIEIKPCTGCYCCQNVEGEYGCIQQDGVANIMERIIAADCVVFATPIYTWYCTPPMKALLDRHCGLNKFYGSASSSLWEGKKIALITTHGYSADYAAGPFEIGIKRLCEHSSLRYMGMYSVRDIDGLPSFQTREAADGARQFARRLMGKTRTLR